MDPTLLAILSIFGGAALTAGAGLFGAWVQSRREHSRWLRDQRYESFSKVLGIMDRFGVLHRNMTDPSEFQQMRDAARDGGDKLARARGFIEASDALMDEFDDALGPVLLLGPDSVREALLAVTESRKTGDEEAQRAARRAAIAEMRRTLGV